MKLSFALYSLLAGLVIYSLLNFAGGDTGLAAMARAESYRDLLNTNLDSIREINRELNVDFDALSSDTEMIKLRARALGYFEKGDHLVNIANWNPESDEYKPGNVLKKEYRVHMDETRFRLTALAGSLFVMVLSVLFSMGSRRKRPDQS